MTKDDFIKKYPKSITAQRAKGLRDQTEWDAYDLVLEYLHSSGQVATIEEANYVMTEMDEKTIQGIVEEQKKNLDEKFNLNQVRIIPALVKGGAAVVGTKMIASKMGQKSGENEIKNSTPVPVDNQKKKKKGNFITNFINKKRDESSIGGNKRVDDTRQGSGDEKVGEKIKF